MYYVDPNLPLPIDIGNPTLGVDFYINGDFSYPIEYCFDTKIKAIEEIKKIEDKLIHYWSVWIVYYYNKLHTRITVYWDKNLNLIHSTSKKYVSSKLIFST